MVRDAIRRWFPIVCALVACGGAHAAAEWPGFRGPNSDGTVPDVELFAGRSAALTLGWKHVLGSGYSAIAVDSGRLFTMFAGGDGDYAAAFDADSGAELWRYRVAEAHAGLDGSHDGPISTPVVAAGRVLGLGPRGDLFALDAATGTRIWQVNLVEAHGAKPPHYGFATSPLVADGVLVVELGGAEGQAIAGFDPADGKLLWTVGDDTMEYHSPIVATLGGRRQVVAAGETNVYGLDAKTGRVLWSHKHDGDDRAMGGMTIVPVPAGDDRLFLMNKIDSGVMLRVARSGDDYAVSELWSGGAIKNSYVVPVYHAGYLYGMANRIFTCMDAATGEAKWRSREPGDGFPILVGKQLVIVTKPGTLHVVEASPEAYREVARLDLFDEHSWSEASYADGHLYARSMGHLARIDLDAGATRNEAGSNGWFADTAFGRFLAELERVPDKSAAIDAYFEHQPSFPIVEESGAVHFVYRGAAQDVAIVGDLLGSRREDPLVRVDGTDLFYYSTRLEPDAALTYGFIVDYGQATPDPRNPRPGDGLFGKVSWLAMPAWRAPRHLEQAAPARRGRLEALQWESAVLSGKQRSAQVYLPAEYDAQRDRRYPVLYVHNGTEALEAGRMANALDDMIGESIEPLIVVFVVPDEENPRRDLGDVETYSAMFVKELVPAIDAKYRTRTERLDRAVAGSGRGADPALFAAFTYPELFGRVGLQAATSDAATILPLARSAEQRPWVVYLEWGTYHLRSPHEAWDLAEENRKLWAGLRAAGYRPAGGESPDGWGWECWNAHTDELLVALFPLRP